MERSQHMSRLPTDQRWPALFAVLLFAWLCAGWPVVAQDGESKRAPHAEQKRLGRLIRLTPPLGNRTEQGVRRAISETTALAKQRAAWPVFILEIEPGPVPFGDAIDLARFLSSPALTGATTIAYVPKSITGHGVLLALACDEIVMGRDAELGDAGKLEPVIDQGLRSSYAEIAKRRLTVPEALALGMINRDAEVLLVETERSREFVLRGDLEQLQLQKAVRSSKVIKAAGAPGLFTARQLREWDVVGLLADDRIEIAKTWKLPREAVVDAPTQEHGWTAAMVELTGVVTPGKVEKIQKLVDTQIRDAGVNFICLWIDSPGGDWTASKSLADDLARRDPRQCRTVAYIAGEARGDAMLPALACDELVVLPSSVLGGAGAVELADDDLQLLRQGLQRLAREKLRPAGLLTALFDREPGVSRYVRLDDGLFDFFTAAQFAQRADAAAWRQDIEVKRPGELLQLDGRRAETLGLASHIVDGFADFKTVYALQNSPRLVQPGWASNLIDALNMPGMSWALLFIGLAAIYIELQSPGISVGGIVGTICFVLYFWSQFLNGTAGWLEVLLFITGVVLILLEVFVVPGVTIFGLSGGLLVLASLILASQTFVWPHNEYQTAHLRDTLVILTGVIAATVVAAVLMNRLLPRTPGLGRMVLAPPSGAELDQQSRRESLASFEHLLGRTGVAITPLVPGGKARFDDELIDVSLASGEYVNRGERVEVIKTSGARVLVKKVV